MSILSRGFSPETVEHLRRSQGESVAHLSWVMASELNEQGIRVNSLAPGSTLTLGTEWPFYGLDRKTYNGKAQCLISPTPFGHPC